jgi:hypothetical protein
MSVPSLTCRCQLLIGPGLLIVGIGLLLMRGLDAGSAWTHLIPGMIVGGVGVGLVNPPLASTAVGVVPPQQAGMASGINSTFRQVGTATGIALLGTLFSNDVKTEVLTRTAAVFGLPARGPEIAGEVRSGQIGNVIARLPAPARQVVGTITRAAFTTGLDRILLVAAIIAFVAGVVSLAAIRSRTSRAPRVADLETAASVGSGRPTVVIIVAIVVIAGSRARMSTCRRGSGGWRDGPAFGAVPF